MEVLPILGCLVLAITFMMLFDQARKDLPIAAKPVNRVGRPMKIVNEKNEPVDILKNEVTEQRLASLYIQPSDIVLELGARYGSVSCMINAKLTNPAMHVAVEPDQTVWEALEQNRHANASAFRIFQGTIGRKGVVIRSDKGYGTQTVAKDEGETLPFCSVDDLGLPFTTLVADCEGCLPTFFQDFPDMYDRLHTVIFEADAGANYAEIQKQLASHGFQPIVQGFQNVWMKSR